MAGLVDIGTALNWEAGVPKGRFTLIDSQDADGGVILHHVLQRVLQNEGGQSVCFVGLDSPLSHFQAVSKKLGNYLRKIGDDRFRFIDGLVQPFSWLPKAVARDKKTLEALDMSGLKLLFKEIESYVMARPEGVCIVIDDISPLLAWVDDARHVLMFMEACNGLLAAQKNSLVALVHAVDADAVEEEAVAAVVGQGMATAAMRHMSDLHLAVGPLSTGYSKDVHGKIVITSKRERGVGKQKPLPDLLHFQVTDSGVMVFVPGSA